MIAEKRMTVGSWRCQTFYDCTAYLCIHQKFWSRTWESVDVREKEWCLLHEIIMEIYHEHLVQIEDRESNEYEAIEHHPVFWRFHHRKFWSCRMPRCNQLFRSLLVCVSFLLTRAITRFPYTLFLMSMNELFSNSICAFLRWFQRIFLATGSVYTTYRWTCYDFMFL